MTKFFLKKYLNKSRQPFSTFLFFRKFPENIVGPYSLFFQRQKKAANYGVIGKLLGDVQYLIFDNHGFLSTLHILISKLLIIGVIQFLCT